MSISGSIANNLASTGASIADHFQKKCIKATEENIRLVWSKLSNPGGLIHFEAGGALLDAAKEGMGALGDLAAELLKENSDLLIMSALNQIADANPSTRQALDLALRNLAILVTLNNDTVFIFMKKVARNALKEIETKKAALERLRNRLIRLYNALLVLDAGDPVYDEWLARLRSAILYLSQASGNLHLVRNTLEVNDIFLARKFDTVDKDLRTAKDLIHSKNSPNPYLDPVTSSLAEVARVPNNKNTENAANAALGLLNATLGIPETGEQINNMIAIPRLSQQVVLASKEYFSSTGTLNALILAFLEGVNALTKAMPAILKKHYLKLFDSCIDLLDPLVESMSYVLNGSTSSLVPPASGFSPNPLQISTNALTWTGQLTVIIEAVKAIPKDSLEKLNLHTATLKAYTQAISELKALDTINDGGAILVATDAQEDAATFEVQLVSFLVEANTSLVSAKIRPGVLSLGRTLLRRINLSLYRDQQIAGILQRFIDTPIPLEEELDKMATAFSKMLSDLGLDRAKDLFDSGNYAAFFGLNGKTATYVGAALAAVGFLMDCFPDPNTRKQLNNTKKELKRDLDLINFKLSIDFDFAIFKNIKECLRLMDLAGLFNLKEILCGLAEDLGVGGPMNAVYGALNSAGGATDSAFAKLGL